LMHDVVAYSGSVARGAGFGSAARVRRADYGCRGGGTVVGLPGGKPVVRFDPDSDFDFDLEAGDWCKALC
jgi:hypothetical protein